MSKDVLQFVSSEFDVFTRKAIQHAVQATDVVIYKAIAPIEQSDLQFLIPKDFDTYVDPDIELYIRGKLIKADGTALDETDHTAGTNDFLHSLFIQCTIALNGVNITQPVTFITTGLISKRFFVMVMTRLRRISQTATGITMRALCCPVSPRSQNPKTRDS